MSKFKVGDKVLVVRRQVDWDGWVDTLEQYVGDGIEYEIKRPGTYKDCFILSNGWEFLIECLELAEDRSTWHPHHDVIVAWAKGAKIQYKEYKSAYEPDPWKWVDHLGISAPAWYSNIEYRVKPEPDHTAEIAEIEQEMRKLSESQKELADRLEKLK